MENISRRNRIDLYEPAELAIYNAMLEVEKIGADVRLTNAVVKLSDAKDLVSDFIDWNALNEAEKEEQLKVGGKKGMDELTIYRFQAEHIEDTFRIVANTLGSRSKETCLDRQIMKSINFIKEILNPTT